MYVTGSKAVVRWHALQDNAVGRWQLVQLPGATPRCENGPVPASSVVLGFVPAVARGFGPEIGGLPAGRTGTPVVGLGLALAAAAAAAAKPPVGLWQSTQSAVVVLLACWPSVLVLKLVPYHVAPLGAWQVLHFGVDVPVLLLPLPRV